MNGRVTEQGSRAIAFVTMQGEAVSGSPKVACLLSEKRADERDAVIAMPLRCIRARGFAVGLLLARRHGYVARFTRNFAVHSESHHPS